MTTEANLPGETAGWQPFEEYIEYDFQVRAWINEATQGLVILERQEHPWGSDGYNSLFLGDDWEEEPVPERVLVSDTSLEKATDAARTFMHENEAP